MKLFRKDEFLEMLATATQTCAPVTVEIGKDYLLITSCPPAVVTKVIDSVTDEWKVSVHGGGLRIDAKGDR